MFKTLNLNFDVHYRVLPSVSIVIIMLLLLMLVVILFVLGTHTRLICHTQHCTEAITPVITRHCSYQETWGRVDREEDKWG